MTTLDLSQIADRLAVTDVLLRYFELVDAKGWDQMHEVFTEDTTARWTPESLIEGRDRVVGAMQHMSGSAEIVTYHHVAVHGPGHQRRRGRGDGPRACHAQRRRPARGKFYESLGIQPTRLVRTPEGWRIKHHDWNIAVKLGSMDDLFAPELAAGKRH